MMTEEDDSTMMEEQQTRNTPLSDDEEMQQDGEALNFDEEEVDTNSLLKIKQLAKMRVSMGGMDDLDALLDGDAAPVDENLLYSMKRKSMSTRETTADDQEENNDEQEERTEQPKSTRKKRSRTSKKKEKNVKDLEDAVYAQYKRNKTIDEDLPSRPVKYINSLDDLVPKILSHLGPIVNSFSCHKRPLRPEIRVDKFVDDKDKLLLKHAMDGGSDDEDSSSSDDDFDLVVTKELKPGSIIPDNEDEEDDEDFEPNDEESNDDEEEESTMEVPSNNTEESEESKKEDETETIETAQETTITDTFNEPLPQTMTLATDLPVEEDSSDSSEKEDEPVELTEEEKEKKQRKELAKKLALKKYIEDMQEEVKVAQAYMSDECEEEDEEGNVLNYRTFDDIKDLDEKEIEEEIGDFVTFSDSDSDAGLVDESVEVESEITHISDEEEDEDLMSLMSFGADDDYTDILERRKKISKLTPKQLAEQLEKNQESLQTLKRKDGGYGQFSTRGSKLLNMTLSKIALPSTPKAEEKKQLEKKERKEAEEKKKEAEKKQMEAFRNAIKKRKREIEKQSSSLVDDEQSTILPTIPSLDSISSFSNSQELLSIMQATTAKHGNHKVHQKNPNTVSKTSFLNKTNHNQKAAKQFAAKQQKLQQKKSKETVSLFSSSIPEKPKKKKATKKK